MMGRGQAMTGRTGDDREGTDDDGERTGDDGERGWTMTGEDRR